MVRKDGSFVKVERLHEIKKIIAKSLPNPVDIPQLKLYIEMNIGLTPERAQDYIEKVVAASGWIILNGKIIASLPESSEEESVEKTPIDDIMKPSPKDKRQHKED